jgi:hypothetical protein
MIFAFINFAYTTKFKLSNNLPGFLFGAAGASKNSALLSSTYTGFY